MPSDLDARLAQQIARTEIAEIMMRYARALDRCDEAMLRSCFHPDSTHQHAGFIGPSSEFCNFAMGVVNSLIATHHQLGNISIELDGDRAFTEAYFTAFHRVPDGGSPALPSAAPGDDVFVAGRYVDRFEKRDGAWLIAHRTGVHDWTRYEPGSDHGFYDTPPETRGTRDRNDPVYRRG